MSARVVAWLAGCLLGSFCSAAAALTTVDFTNTGTTVATPSEFENNTTNNSSSVVVLPKGMKVTKTADATALSTPTAAGDLITYTILVENLGLLGLTNVSLSDTIIPAANLTLISGDSNGDSILDGTETWQFEGTYAITQADLDSNGGGDADIDNTVTVSTDELPPMSDDAEVDITQAPSFSVSKIVDAVTVATPTTVNYTIDVVNTGNLTLTGLAVSDTLPDGTPAVLVGPLTDTGLPGSLDVGETWRYTTSYAISQSEIDAGSALVNSVDVTANETGPTPQNDTATTTVDAKPALTIEKVVDQPLIAQPGPLLYTITVENTGNVSLTNVVLGDVLPDGAAGTPGGPTGDAGAPGVMDVGKAGHGHCRITSARRR